MTLYQMGSRNPYNKPFRISFAVAIILLLAALWLSLKAPPNVTDHTRELIADIATAILIAAILIGVRFMSDQSKWRITKEYRIEISEGKLIQSRAGSAAREIPLNQIVSLTESRGRWLIVRGSKPGQRIAIPHEIEGFENLKQKITANLASPAQQIKLSPWLFLPGPALLLAVAFLVFSHDQRNIVAAGILALILQGVSTYSISRLNKYPQFPLIMIAYALGFFLIAFILYLRA